MGTQCLFLFGAYYCAGDNGRGIPSAMALVTMLLQALKRMLRRFASLERIFEARPFLLGDHPTLADIGFSGPFFRHFALDPIPLQILRHTAPRTLSG